VVLWRTLATGIGGTSILALMALIARDMLGGGAQTFGIMLGAFGMGAVVGALNVETMRKQFSSEVAIRICVMTMAARIARTVITTITSIKVKPLFSRAFIKKCSTLIDNNRILRLQRQCREIWPVNAHYYPSE